MEKSQQKFASLSRDFISDKHLHQQIRLLTEEEFHSILEGRGRVKPKLLMHPLTQQLYRWVQAHGEAGGYLPINVPDTKVIVFEVAGESLQRFKNRAPALPRDVEVRCYHLQSAETRIPGKGEISRTQLYALMNAVGQDSHWWPLDDPYHDSQYYFERLQINVVFKNSKPVGISMWEPQPDENGRIYSSFFGIVPWERTISMSGWLYKWTQYQLAQLEPKSVISTTSEHDSLFNLQRKSAQEGAPRKGVKILEIISRGPNHFAEQPRESHAVHFLCHSDLNMSGEYYEDGNGKLLPRYQEETLKRNLWREFGVMENVHKKAASSRALV